MVTVFNSNYDLLLTENHFLETLAELVISNYWRLNGAKMYNVFILLNAAFYGKCNVIFAMQTIAHGLELDKKSILSQLVLKGC